MGYQPRFTITPALLGRVEAVAALRERIQRAAVQVAWIPALQKDTRARNAHSSTAIEGNPLTLEQVRAGEAGDARAGGRVRAAAAGGGAGADARAARMVERRRPGSFAGAELRDRALPVRGDPSVRRRQRPHRPRARAVGALPARVRYAPHFLGGRV